MDDKTMLELAAKAAGIRTVWVDTPYERCFKIAYEAENVSGWRVWNPLTDDGDALRLAVKLKLGVTFNYHGDRALVSGYAVDSVVGENLGSDPYASTRRAITRAAAEIGKAIGRG